MMCEQRFEQEQCRYELPAVDLLRENSDVDLENQKKVFARSIFESEEWKNSDAEIPLALGEDKNGKPVMIDLTAAPHILMAGATGSGKSVCMNTMIMSLLFRFRPEELRFILFDPKIVEFERYKNLPHLLTPVINDSEKFLFALRWATGELDRRYHVMSDAGVETVREFNARSNAAESHEFLPFIVIVIDELADLMVSNARRNIEKMIAYIAQGGRGAGIHLIVSTSRPSERIITGIIRASLPTRICFQVRSQFDSRVVLGRDGAEKLQGLGDMLCIAPSRIQGALTADEDIERVVHFVSGQAAPQFNDCVSCAPQEESVCAFSPEEEWNRPEYAPLLKKYLHPDDPPLARAALALVLTEGRISPSFLQRHLETGYNQASSMIELFEERGIIRLSPDGGPKYELLISADCGGDMLYDILSGTAATSHIADVLPSTEE